MIRRLDKLWYWVLDKAHRWIAGRVVAHCLRNVEREAREDSREQALRRLHGALVSQNPHLN
jgi:hypothetical protein